ncbi:MAG: hypothetical protein AB7N76_27075 [Planctomycetota bacterium]
MTAARRIARTSIDPVSALGPADRAAMFQLMDRYYRGMTREHFDADLDAKQHLIRMFDQDGLLCGFSTLQRLWVEHAGRKALVVFSGDTVIDEACWGQKQLQNAFTRYLVRTWFERPFRPLYWFLISKGFKTYLLMRHNFASWPSHRAAALPGEVQAVLDAAARAKYPDRYDAARGLIVAPRHEDHQAVKEPYLELTQEELANPEIRYFVQRNPEHHLGDELCCLAKVRLRELCWIALKYGLWHPLRRLLGLGREPRAPAPATPATSTSASEV